MRKGTDMIAAERERQITEEGWTAGHDSNHIDCELLQAACSYGLDVLARENAGNMYGSNYQDMSDSCWPWSDASFKPTPKDTIRQLVKAGALIAAEIDRRLK